MYAKVENGLVVEYPYTNKKLRKDNPLVGFPKDLTDDIRLEHGMVEVVVEAAPTVTSSQKLTQDTTPALVDGTWTLGWTVSDKTAEEVTKEVEDSRLAMVLTRGEFALSAHKAGLLTEAEALAWAGGTALPPSIIAIIDSLLPPSVRLKYKLEALSVANVRRTATLFLRLKDSMGLTDEQADNLFINAERIQ